MTQTLHPEETVTSFLLVRHGHTRATEQGRLYTDLEAPLTETGMNQAHALAAWMAGQAPDMVLTSPAARVRTTASIIASALGKEPIIIEGLHEWQVGVWEGRTYLDIKNEEPELYKRWSSNPIKNAPPGGESIVDLCRRVKQALAELIERFAGRRLALVTHAGIIRGMIVEALGLPAENFWRLSVPVGSVSKVDFSANFATLQYLSCTPDRCPVQAG